MFNSILDAAAGSLTISNALLCTFCSLVLGFAISFTATSCSKISKNFAISLVILPVLIQVVIMMVNGNLGAGVAVMGAFSLVRFRSLPGNTKDICSIFFTMTVGLATGMGYLTFAIAVTALVCLVFILLSKLPYGETSYDEKEKELKILMPEDLDYTNIFEDLFDQYTDKVSLQRIKTVNLGSMYEIIYHITLKNTEKEKLFIDELRCRNGNLTIVCGRRQTGIEEF